jgi:2-polyprenyl-3-methyl-5-hydroxy-6-metoxy-1,4-benzoquinol methylase
MSYRNHRRGDYTAPTPKTFDRDEEIARYAELYSGPGYGMGAKRQMAVQGILSRLLPRGTLLDVSTGRGETLNFADRLGFEAIGTEVVDELLVPERVIFAEARKLPFANGAFDHVTCFDVLEHLVEEDVHACLAEMRRVARVSVTASASERPSVFGTRDLHISKRPAAEWADLMAEKWGGALRIENAGGSPCWQWRL